MGGNNPSSAAGLEWRLNVQAASSVHHHHQEILEAESCSRGRASKIWLRLQSLFKDAFVKFWSFLEKAWHIGKSDPKKVMHCFKVGLALTLVSIFYYMRPLYDGVGGNAMWAVMTVVVVFEYTVGATLAKCVNRTVGTLLAGSLGIGVHWLATQSGETFEPIILQISVFLLATVATFSRFIPTIKARFDYGAMIFILTFSLVSVSGYRVDKLFELAHSRLSTIAIGTSICILTSMLFFPVWAGFELHFLVTTNISKLADSLDERFRDGILGIATKDDDDKDGCSSRQKSQAYKCVLNTKATEESLANFARWEPGHGNFSFQHPWKQYLKVGASICACAYYMETLNGTIDSKPDLQAAEFLNKYLGEICNKLSCCCSNVLKEVATTIMTRMKKSSKICLLLEDLNISIEELENALKFLPDDHQSIISIQGQGVNAANNDTGDEPNTKPLQIVPLMDIVPLVTVASLMKEIAARVKGIVEAVEELADQADFKPDVQRTTQTHMKNGDTEDHDAIQKV